MAESWRFCEVGSRNARRRTAESVSLRSDWANMVDGIGTTKYTYSAAGQLLTEDGPYASDTVTSAYSNRLRTSPSLQQPTGSWTNGFAYDSTKRLTNVTSPAGSFGYLYESDLLTHHPERITLPNTSYITNVFDANARLTATYLKNSGNSALDSYIYVYNTANQRTHLTRADASTVGYNYDSIGQLTNADSSVNSEDRGYAYDAAWNLKWLTNNGSASQFIVDNKNQLTNAPSPVGKQSYDSNGNLASSHYSSGFQWGYYYDDENRLSVLIRTNGTDITRSDFIYDGLGRLRERIEYAPDSGGAGAGAFGAVPVGDWAFSSGVIYIYDGWRVIQERDTNNTPTVSYTRGNDLSGSMEGAGGIGGLLGRSSGYSGGNFTTHNYYFADGNGNVTYMLNSSQSMVASYRYDPFGNTISSSGTLASANVYRFSSKEIHANSGMYYYGYRFYDPNLQRWINRDPLNESGFELVHIQSAQAPNHRFSEYAEITQGPNLYAFARNSAYKIDAFGLCMEKVPDPCKDKCQADKQECEQRLLEEMPSDPYELIGFLAGMEATCGRAYHKCIWKCDHPKPEPQ